MASSGEFRGIRKTDRCRPASTIGIACGWERIRKAYILRFLACSVSCIPHYWCPGTRFEEARIRAGYLGELSRSFSGVSRKFLSPSQAKPRSCFGTRPEARGRWKKPDSFDLSGTFSYSTERTSSGGTNTNWQSPPDAHDSVPRRNAFV